jgi:putative salt-induced outer membrane protein YdiY
VNKQQPTLKTMKHHRIHSNLLAHCAVAAGLMLAGRVTASAQAAPAPETLRWSSSAAAGLTLTRGNSETFLTTITLDSKRKWKTDEASVGAAAGYGTSDSDRNTDFVQAYGQYNRLFSEKFYGGLRLDANHDGIADLSYRVRFTPLAGYYLIKEPKTSLTVECGPSIVTEKYERLGSETYLGIRFGERYEHQLTASTKIWQSLEYVPRVDEWFDKYLINGEAGIDAAINSKWSLRVVLQVLHDSDPAPGNDSTDLRLIAGAGYKF